MKYDGLQQRWMSLALIREVNPGAQVHGASVLEEEHLRIPVSTQLEISFTRNVNVTVIFRIV